ncbi:PAS domain S-box protein [Halobaculum limi]|uniref:PAS domain S-box protein n=1 Tax=Halobaculum limi TaxID=3031916 RepID=UPI0024062535|nr:PAS domain S-box protein [Halobaculum sp. YSMS11]
MPAVVCGGADATRAELIKLISDRSDLSPVEPLSSSEDGVEVGADHVGIVICLADPARGDGSVDPTIERAAEAVGECPVVAVGSSVDAAAAYEAGATDVVGLNPTDYPETFIDQITAIVDRYVAGAFEMAMVNETDHGIVVHDPETAEVVACNERFYDLLGYDSSTYDITLSDFVDHDEAFSRERAVALVREAAAGESVSIEWRDPTNEGTDIWVEVRLEAAEFFDESYVVGSVQDISERKARERDLEWSRETLQRVHEITADPDLMLEDQVDELIRFATDRLDVDAGYLGRVDVESNDYEVEVAHGDERLVREGMTLPFDETYCQFVVDDPERSMAAEPDVNESDVIDASVTSDDAPTCYVGSEIRVDGDLYGMVCFVEQTTRASSFTDEEQTLVRHIVEWLRREFEQVQYRREVDQTRDRLEDTFDRVSDAFFGLDRDWRVRYANDTGAGVLRDAMDLPADAEVRGRHLWEEVPDAVGTRFESAYRQALREQEQVTFEEYFEAMDTWFEVRAYPDEGGLSVYFSDVTDRKWTQRARRRLITGTQELFDAETNQALADAVAETAADVFERPATLYLADDSGDRGDTETFTAVSTAGTDAASVDGQVLAPDDEAVWPAHRDETTVVELDGDRDRDSGGDDLDAVLLAPVGDRGTIAIAGDDSVDFDETDRDLAELLSVNTETAVAKLDRRRELERYETLFETAREMTYVVDDDGRIELISEPLAAAIGYDREDLVGTHISEISTDETEETATERVVDLLVTPGETSDTFEGALLTRDGTELPVEVELALLPYDDSFRGTVGSVRDISERRQREEELEIVQQAVTEAGVGLAMYDESGHLEYVNDQCARLLGRTRESVEETPAWESITSIDADGFETYWESFDEGETRTQETQLRRADRSTTPVETVTTRVTIDGETHNIVTVHSIAGRRERRQQSEVLHRVLRHNLRNDLTVIHGHADLLVDRLDGAEAETATTIRRRANHLDDIADTAQQAQTVINRDVVRKPVDVIDQLREAAARVVPDAGVHLTADVPERHYVLASSTLQFAFEQLLENAVEHAEGDATSIDISVSRDDERDRWTEIAIADDGPGIPEHEVAVLSAGEETSLQHGSGLGLWVAHWVVTRYGGELEFDDCDDGGTVVRVRLPSAESTTSSESVTDRRQSAE